MRFGPWAKIYVSIMYLTHPVNEDRNNTLFTRFNAECYLGWSMITVIIITGLSVMIYSLLGGIQAVVWTDAIQGIILISGALICAIVLLFSMPEGPGQLFQIAAENHKFSLGSLKMGLTSSTFWVVLIYGIFINLQNFGIDQNYIQRYMTASSEKEAKKSALYGGLLVYTGFIDCFCLSEHHFSVIIQLIPVFYLIGHPAGQSFSVLHY